MLVPFCSQPLSCGSSSIPCLFQPLNVCSVLVLCRSYVGSSLVLSWFHIRSVLVPAFASVNYCSFLFQPCAVCSISVPSLPRPRHGCGCGCDRVRDFASLGWPRKIRFSNIEGHSRPQVSSTRAETEAFNTNFTRSFPTFVLKVHESG